MTKANVRIAVLALAAVLVLVVGGGIACAMADKNMPDYVITIGGTAVGALAALVLPKSVDESRDAPPVP